MDQKHLERVLVRCRLLITRGAIIRLGFPTESEIRQLGAKFTEECHVAFKKAAEILVREMLQLDREIQEAKAEKPLVRKQEYWLHILELAFDSFIWIAANLDRSNVVKIYKGPKFGSLAAQNITSVIESVDERTAAADVFAFPLDFSRFSCIADAVRITHKKGGVALDFIEVKEGHVNAKIFDMMISKHVESVTEVREQLGEKAAKQAERMLRQEQLAKRQLRFFGADPGIYETADERRIISVMKLDETSQFDGLVEILLDRARKGEYSTDIVDGTLAVTALNRTSQQRYVISDFSSRVTVHSQFFSARSSSEG